MDEEENFLAEAERRAKQSFLREEVVDAGYSPQLFVSFCELQRGADVDLWSFDELHQCVVEFKKIYKPGDLPTPEAKDPQEEEPQTEASLSAQEEVKEEGKEEVKEEAEQPVKDKPEMPEKLSAEELRLAEMTSKGDSVYTIQGATPPTLEIKGSIDIFVTE
jgi:hypothetical protein